MINQLFRSWTTACPSSWMGFQMWRGVCWPYAERGYPITGPAFHALA